MLTYQVDTGPRRFAVRCFHREVPTIERRYRAISSALRGLSASCFVAFDFQPEGIQIRGGRYPIVKMDWVEGETLGAYLDRHASDRAAMAALRRRFAELAAYLGSVGVAHGDLQNANVIVDRTGGLRLIDYDGVFVPSMARGNGTEVGHKHFQHPGRTTAHFGPAMDRFSFIALDLSLAVLETAPGLHGIYREGGEAIVFKANDYADPSSSEVFRTLAEMPAVSRQALRFAGVCEADIAEVPSLEDFLAGRNLPASLARSLDGRGAGATAAYIGAYTTLDAADYEAALGQVGNRVELVGRVVSIKSGIGKYGRPYLFINFGNWRTRSVKLTIWSEGLSTLAAMPDKTWVGTWVSAVGLIEQPYEGKRQDRPYSSVGPTILDQSQIVRLSEEQALFRLGKGKRERPKTAQAGDRVRARDSGGHPDEVVRSNREALSRLAPIAASSPPPPARRTGPRLTATLARPQAAVLHAEFKLLEQLNRLNTSPAPPCRRALHNLHHHLGRRRTAAPLRRRLTAPCRRYRVGPIRRLFPDHPSRPPSRWLPRYGEASPPCSALTSITLAAECRLAVTPEWCRLSFFAPHRYSRASGSSSRYSGR